MPSRLPSPSSPTLAASSRPQGNSGRLAQLFQTRATASRRGEPGAVVGDAGTVEPAVGLGLDLVLVARRDHGVEVGGEGDVGAVAFGGDDVAGAVDDGVPAEGAELVGEPGGALLLEEGGGGNAAELQVDLVDPLLLAGEPLETLAHAAVFREFAQVHPCECIGRHSACCQCSRGV